MTKKLFNIARRVARDWPDHQIGQSSAAIAYFAIFALAPTLVFATAAATQFLSQEAARELARERLATTLGPGAAELAETVFTSAKFMRSGWLTNLLSAGMLLYGASAVFVQLRLSLNTIFNHRSRPERSALLRAVFGQLRSMGFVLLGGVVLLASLLGSVALHATTDRVSAATGLNPAVWEWLSFTLSFTLVASVLLMVFAWLPSSRPPWRYLVVGALLSAALFELGKWAFSSFVTGSVIASAYGPSSALVAFLLWIYYSAHIILLGAQVSHAIYEESFQTFPKEDGSAE